MLITQGTLCSAARIAENMARAENQKGEMLWGGVHELSPSLNGAR
jgi:hypothetical protein